MSVEELRRWGLPDMSELEEIERLRDEAAMWRQQYERERVRLGYVLGWLTPESFGGDESKQHAYIAIMDTAAAVGARLRDSARLRAESERAVLRAMHRLHRPDGRGQWCQHEGFSWPCPTIRAALAATDEEVK